MRPSLTHTGLRYQVRQAWIQAPETAQAQADLAQGQIKSVSM